MAVSLLFLLCTSHLAAAELRRFQPAQYAMLSALAVGNLLLLGKEPPSSSGWQGGILLDDSFRDGLRLSSKTGRATVADVGDLFLVALIAYPVVADAVVDTWLTQANSDSAGQLALIATQAFFLTGFLRQMAKSFIPRDRPYQRECGSDPQYADDCNKEDSRASFFSGHAAYSFTGAGLVCAAHENLNLYAGMTPCYVALGLATFVSLSRTLADKHFTSDVLTGATIGLLSGYLLPKWLNYGVVGDAVVVPTVSERGVGMNVAWGF